MVCSHPFVLDVRPVRYLAGRFAYSIRQPGKPKVHSHHTFGSFDEARVAGKAVLDQMIVQWLEREVVATSDPFRQTFETIPNAIGHEGLMRKSRR